MARWLEAFVDPPPIRSRGAFHVVSARRPGDRRRSAVVLPSRNADLDPANTNAPFWLRTDRIPYPRAVETVDPLGRTIRTVETTLQTTVTRDGVARFSEARDGFGRPTLRTPADGVARYFHYDGLNRVAEVGITAAETCVDASDLPAPCSYAETFAYDDVGRVVEEGHSDGTAVRRHWDHAGRPTYVGFYDGAVETALGSWSYTTGSAAALATVGFTDETGTSWLREVDGYGREASEHVLGLTRTLSRGTAGRLVQETDWNGLATTFEHDVHDRVTAVEAPATGTTAYRYGGDGRLVQTTDADGVVSQTAYVFSGRPAATKVDCRVLQSVTYDDAGRVVEATDDGVTSDVDYDSLDRPIRIARGVGSSGPAPIQIELAWDAGDRLVERRLFPAAGAWATTELAWVTEEVLVGAGGAKRQRAYSRDAGGEGALRDGDGRSGDRREAMVGPRRLWQPRRRVEPRQRSR